MHKAILLDLETPSLANKKPFQITCKVLGENNILNLHVNVGDFPFNPVNKSSCKDGVLIQNGQEIKKLFSLKEAIFKLFDWLYENRADKTFIVGHNIWSFDSPIILQLFQDFKLATPTEMYQDGFFHVDTRCFIPTSLKDYGPHEALGDLLLLEKLLDKFGVTMDDFKHNAIRLENSQAWPDYNWYNEKPLKRITREYTNKINYFDRSNKAKRMIKKFCNQIRQQEHYENIISKKIKL